jgi:anoctamin-1
LFFHANNNNIRSPSPLSNRLLQLWQDSKAVDFVLAYVASDRQKIKRQIFERNLLSEGLLLDRDEAQDNIHFLKIHVTHEVLCRYAEILKFKFPIKLDDDDNEYIEEGESKVTRKVKSWFEGIYKYVRLDKTVFPKHNYELYHEFSRDKSYLFDFHEPNFFPRFVRLAVINFILERTAFADRTEDNQNSNIGIDKLLADSAYISAYPLHDGHHRDQGTQRALLFNEWALMKNWIKHQPLDTIKNYFGVKIALYFSWLGFYTNMLILPAILGVFCFLYGLITMFSDDIP